MRKLRVTGKPRFCTHPGELGFRVSGLLTYVGLIFVMLGGSCAVSAASEPDVTKNVLILESFTGRSGDFLTQLKPQLRARVSWPVDYYVENLESQRFKENGYSKNLAETLRSSYANRRLDLVIVVNYPALQFAATYRDRMFPGVPIVFMVVDANRLKVQKLWPNVTGVTATVDIRGTIDLALHLHPDTKTIAVVSNTSSEFEKYWLAAVQDELQQRRDRVKEIDLVDLPTAQLLQGVAALPQNSVVIVQLAPQDSVQRAMGDDDVVMTIAQQRPTYCIAAPFCMDRGGVGTADFDGSEQVSLAVNMAARVLSGERPENISVVNGTLHQVRVDWRQLRRWNIPESALPPGSVMLYREPTFWERDRKYIMAAVLVILAQSLLIAGLLWQRARKQKAEAVLRESEKRFRVMADTTPSLIWIADQNGKITYLNSKSVEFTGDPRAGFGDSWSEYVHPDDLDGVLSANARALAKRLSFSKEYRLRRHDGVYRWMFDVASPRVNGDGSFAGFIGSAIDITDQKMAQEALENVSGRLIEAQEKERSRIARDLHDDICQRLALLSMELEQANRSLNASPEVTNERLEEIRRHCSEITGDVQALSHQLHSSKLDYLGITAAIRSFCREFAKQHDGTVEFNAESIPTHLPKDVSLCLFRIVQESLHNAVKYSGTNRYTVHLKGACNNVQLEVADSGVGFDPETAKVNGGLGLLSMQERVHLVRGEFFLESSPGKGTRILASVP
ncbi:MAG TPA: ABC transporter substrate binding protein, partial [Terriglobales bacterium]